LVFVFWNFLSACHTVPMKWIKQPQKEEGTFVAYRMQERSMHRKVVFLILGAVAIIGWVYVLFGSEIFRVKTIDVGTLIDLNRGEVTRAAFNAIDAQTYWPLPNRNLFLVNKKQLAQTLKQELFVDSVTVDKVYPNVLRLKMKERQSSIILIANNQFYLLDHNGVGTRVISGDDEAEILKRLDKPSPTSKTDTPILSIHGIPEFVLGEQFVTKETAQEWLKAFQDLSQADFGYRNAIVDYATSTKLVLNMFEPYDVYFDLLTPLQPQLQSFYAFMRAKAPGTVIQEYVDARIPGRVYYK
jgi:hypothetical protein